MIARAKTFLIERQWPPRATPATVEVDVRAGLPSFTIVGSADLVTRESRERVRAAINACGLEFPQRPITVQVLPRPARRSGEADLAIACALLGASGQIATERLDTHALFGSLLLSGEILASAGALVVAEAAQRQGLGAIVLSPERALEASIVEELKVICAATLARAAAVLSGADGEAMPRRLSPAAHESAPQPDLADIRGQRAAIEAITLAASGGHSLLLIGPAGSGKTLLARRMPGILPDLGRAEALEVTRLQSVLGINRGDGLAQARPFRAPHHSVSATGLAGEPSRGFAGEVQLANRGVLLLENVVEFNRGALDALARSLAAGGGGAQLDVCLLASASPCPCEAPEREQCRCTPSELHRYSERLAHALGRPFDIVVNLAAPKPGLALAPGPGTRETRARVTAARKRQYERHGEPLLNTEIDRRTLERGLGVDDELKRQLRRLCVERRLADIELERVLRIARTAADLAGAERVRLEHFVLGLELGKPAEDR